MQVVSKEAGKLLCFAGKRERGDVRTLHACKGLMKAPEARNVRNMLINRFNNTRVLNASVCETASHTSM